MANNFEAGELSLTSDYVPPYYGEQMLGGRKVVFETFGDEAEIDSFQNEALKAPMSSEEVRQYIESILEYLTWPLSRDGFDFGEDGTELDPIEAHQRRREWELQSLSGTEKLRADKTAFNWNQMGGILNSFAMMALFSQMEHKREDFQNPQGEIPPLLAELAAEASALMAVFENTYRQSKYSERVEMIKTFRIFAKDAVRKLFDAYIVT